MNQIINQNSEVKSLPALAEIDSIGLSALQQQVTYDEYGLLEVSNEKLEKWSVGDFVELAGFFENSAKTAVDNMTRLLLLAYYRGFYDQVKNRFAHRFNKQTVNQWKTQIGIANILQHHELPIRCIEALRSDFSKKLLEKSLRDPIKKNEIKNCLLQGKAASLLRILKRKYEGKQTQLEDVVISSHTPDRQFEEYIFSLFKIDKPDYVWTHIGADKRSEMGLDIIGDKRSSQLAKKIGIQVKLYANNSFIPDDDWRDFLAGCTLHRVDEIYFVGVCRLTSRQQEQARMADITLMFKDQINQMADRLSVSYFNFSF
jgi:hypothetical protein